MHNKTYIPYKVTVLSPVHIGSGRRLGKVDTIFSDGKFIVIDIDKLIYLLSNNQKAFGEFENSGFNIKEFLDRYRIKYQDVQKYVVEASSIDRKGDVFECIKTGLGRPLIPGSSIKGAIRTVFLYHLVKEKGIDYIDHKFQGVLAQYSEKKDIDRELDKELTEYFRPSGKNEPNYDLMRVLQVKDAEFELRDIEVKEVKIFDLKISGGYGWWRKKGGKSFIVNVLEEGTSSLIEAIKKGSFSTVGIGIDDFLLSNQQAQKELKFHTKKEYFDDLADMCNRYASEFIVDEIRFFKDCGAKMLEDFCHYIKSQIPDRNKGFLLHLGWGTGWRAKTGNYLDELSSFQEIRNRLSLSKKGFFFPKTRKVIFERGRFYSLPGWVRLERVG